MNAKGICQSKSTESLMIIIHRPTWQFCNRKTHRRKYHLHIRNLALQSVFLLLNMYVHSLWNSLKKSHFSSLFRFLLPFFIFIYMFEFLHKIGIPSITTLWLLWFSVSFSLDQVWKWLGIQPVWSFLLFQICVTIFWFG